jgi:large subunit ribosomal protein L15e
MGAFKYIKESFEKSFKTRPEFHRKRLQAWRRTSSVVRVENPFNPGRARELGYKASKDFIVVRVKTPRGKVKRKRPDLGRKPAKNRLKENPGKPWLWFAKQKVRRYHPNLKVVNAYWIGEDGSNQYFEVILKTKA